MGIENQTVGPPGCSKTTSLSYKIGRDVEKVGPAGILVASFTVTATHAIVAKVEEVKGNLGIPRGNMASLHSMGYRLLGSPPLIESREGIEAWNAACTADKKWFPWKLSVKKARASKKKNEDAELTHADEGVWDQRSQEDTHGDWLLAEVGKLRAQMLPMSAAIDREVGMFAAAWEQFKRDTGMIDFPDMLELPRTRRLPQPSNARIFVGDEWQDTVNAGQALVRWWGTMMDEITLCGDPAQALYDWTGGNGARVFLDHPVVPPGIRYVLPQSYRVPVAVHAYTESVFEKMKVKEPREYKPRPAEGEVRRLPPQKGTWLQPRGLIQDAQKYLGETMDWGERKGKPKRVIFQVACAYMLKYIKEELRAQGIPFFNPFRCSPADEPILTTEGWVPIGELHPERHRLAGYHAGTNALSWGGRSGPRRIGDERGFAFTIGHQPYEGNLLTITTDRSRTRVTPNHRVRVRYADAFYNKWMVYLMRRGEWWRVGCCTTERRPYINSGAGNRLTTEFGDDAWILGIYESKKDALIAEATIQSTYGIPGMTFPHREDQPFLTSGDITMFYDGVKEVVASHVQKLMKDFGLDLEWPLYRRNSRERRTNYAFETIAANLISGYFEMPVIPDAFLSPNCNRIQPEWHVLTVTKEHFSGDVYSMDVPHSEHYISGMALVHNSRRGDWNPLGGNGRGVTARDKVMALLRPDSAQWGQYTRPWTGDDLKAWLDPLKAAGLIRKGQKKTLDSLGPLPVGFAKVGEILEVEPASALFAALSGQTTADVEQLAADGLYEVLTDLILSNGSSKTAKGVVSWYREHLLDTQKDKLDYALTVASRTGIGGLRDEPQVMIGTYHSFKGAEAAAVYCFPDLSQAGMEEWNAGGERRDSLLRLQYVGVSRASESLMLCSPAVSRQSWVW